MSFRGGIAQAVLKAKTTNNPAPKLHRVNFIIDKEKQRQKVAELSRFYLSFCRTISCPPALHPSKRMNGTEPASIERAGA